MECDRMRWGGMGYPITGSRDGARTVLVGRVSSRHCQWAAIAMCDIMHSVLSAGFKGLPANSGSGAATSHCHHVLDAGMKWSEARCVHYTWSLPTTHGC